MATNRKTYDYILHNFPDSLIAKSIRYGLFYLLYILYSVYTSVFADPDFLVGSEPSCRIQTFMSVLNLVCQIRIFKSSPDLFCWI